MKDELVSKMEKLHNAMEKTFFLLGVDDDFVRDFMKQLEEKDIEIKRLHEIIRRLQNEN